jgi:hypothetical protein
MTGLPTLKVEVEFTDGVWTDLTSSINLARSEIVATRGRSSQSDDGQPGTFSCTFENMTGDLTPDNPAGTYYPNVVPGKRLRYTVGAVVRFYGRIISWDPSYTGNADGDSVVAVSARDTLGDLAATRLRSGLWYEQQADAPFAQYGLDGTVLVESSGNNRPAMVPVVMGEGGTLSLAATPDVPFNDGPVAVFETPSAADNTYLHGFIGATTFIKTLSARVLVRKANTTAYTGLVSVGNNDSLAIAVEAKLGPNGRPLLRARWGDASVPVNAAVENVEIPFDTWVHVAITTSGSVLTFYLDGVSQGTATATGSPGMPLYGVYVGTGGAPDVVCAVADVAVYSGTALTTERIQAHAHATAPRARESVGERVARVCGYIGLTPGGSIQGKTLAGQPFGGRYALEVLQEAVRGDTRLLYDQGGLVVYRQDDHPTTPAVTYDAEADLDGPPTWTRTGQGRAATQTAESYTAGVATATDDGAPVATNGSTITTALAYIEDVAAVAQRAVAEARDARLRLSRLVVDLVTAENAVTADTQTLALGDLVRVDGLPTGILGWTYMDGYLLGSTERASIGSYVVEMDLEAADAPVDGRFGVAAGGRFGTDGTATVGTLTSSGTTVVITSAGTPFTTAAGSYPLDVDIDGERVTLNNAPASSTSPQTFTGVTRGVAPSVARAHSAGESVDVWRAARFTT